MLSKFCQILVLTLFVFTTSIISNSLIAQTKENPSSKSKSEIKTEKGTDSKIVKDKKADNAPFNTVCPVTGEDVDKDARTYTYNGKTYALCCNKCLSKFEKNPEKYIKRLSEDGKSFK